MSFTAFEGALRDAAERLRLPLNDLQVDGLLRYLALVQKWTRVYNLTAVRNPAEMLTHHLFDSLAAVPALMRHVAGRTPGQLLDVGSGAGLPGVVFAVCLPEWTVRCVDTVGKKAAFIQQAAAELGLSNLRSLHARVEQIVEPYDVITARAFASLADFVAWSDKALASDGIWMALKGKRPLGEIATLPRSIDVFHVEQLVVPQLEADRCIVWMRRAAAPLHPVA